MITESEAWRMIGEAFEARAAHPDLTANHKYDLARDGMCSSVMTLQDYHRVIDGDTASEMERKAQQAVADQRGELDLDMVRTKYIQPWITEPEGSDLRSTLAYLFAEATA